MTATDSELLEVSSPETGVALIVMNRPKARNALSLDMLGALRNAVQDAGQKPDIAAIVLAANGPAFSSGHDLKELTAHRQDTDGGKAFFEQTMQTCSALMQDIVNCPKPVIAAVEGMATAAGCQLVASCDLAVAAHEATFATPGVNIGLFCSTPMVALSRNVPRKKAMEMLLLGEAMHASDAQAFGLVNKVVDPDAVRSTALEMARKIAAKSKITVSIGKPAFYSQIEHSLEDAYAEMSRVMVHNMLEQDAEEGICAFLEKRLPKWST